MREGGPWLTPEEILEIGFRRSRVVMMNEAHHGMLRCVRTRRLGTRLIPVAHELGVRHLAMEALPSTEPPGIGLVGRMNRERTVAPVAELAPATYPAQPDMRELIQTALDLGWTLHGYEAHMTGDRDIDPDAIDWDLVNWRETTQAANLAALARELGPDTLFLVWCGWGHHYRAALPGPGPEWRPMGCEFRRLTGIEHFAIDQTVTVDGDGSGRNLPDPQLAATLRELGGTAGRLVEDGMVDARVYSLDNAME